MSSHPARSLGLSALSASGALCALLETGALCTLLATAVAVPAAAGSDDVITMRGSRVEVAALPRTSGVDVLRGTRRGGGPDLGESTMRVRESGRNALRAQLRGMLRTYEEHLGLAVPPSAHAALPLLGDRHALRATPGPGVSREAFEQRELEGARLVAAGRLLRAALPGAPAWLEVGLAQYLEGIEVAGGATAVYPQPAQDVALRLALAQGRLLPLENVLARSAAGFDASVDGALASAQAWALVFFLMEQGDGHELMRGVLDDLERDRDASLRSLSTRFGGSAQLDREWRRFLGESRRAHLLFLTDELRRSLEERDQVAVYERPVLAYPGFYGTGFFHARRGFFFAGDDFSKFRRRGFGKFPRYGFRHGRGGFRYGPKFVSRPGQGGVRAGFSVGKFGKSGGKLGKSGKRGKRGKRGKFSTSSFRRKSG